MRLPGVFGINHIDLRQGVDGALGYIAHIADGGGDDVKCFGFCGHSVKGFEILARL